MSEQLQSTSSSKEESQLVTFYLGNEEFGFDIMSVQEIIRQPKLSRIPMAPPHIEGIANLRGLILPILDTRTRFGLPKAEDTDSTRVLVVDVDGNKTGLRVDRVRQVTRVQLNEMEPPPPVIREGLSSDFLASVVKKEGGKRIIMALNPKAICQGANEAVQKAVASSSLESRKQSGTPQSDGDSTERSTSVTQLVTFKLGHEEFAFNMERVHEIRRVERCSEVPDSPKHILGILTVRGNILPVIDLRALLGMNSLDSELAEKTRQTSSGFQEWFNAARAKTNGLDKGDISGPEAIRTWMGSINTSSQNLLAILGGIRAADDRLLRAVSQAQKSSSTTTRTPQDLFQQEIEPVCNEITRLLGLFEENLKENIREDQRLILVQTHGFLLALLVDKVREVLNMPTHQIDPPPQYLSESKTFDLSGIAKLENGKRLILLLDANQLVKHQDLHSIQGLSQKNASTDSKSNRPENEKSVSAEQQFVTFRLGDVDYGVPIAKVQEIDRSSRMTRVPRTATYMDGITNLRGEVVPVINARKRFNLAHQPPDERTRVIIMETNGVKTGLLVDSVREVLNLAAKDIAPPPASLSTSIDRDYISGIGKVDGDKRMILLLDVAKVLAP